MKRTVIPVAFACLLLATSLPAMIPPFDGGPEVSPAPTDDSGGPVVQSAATNFQYTLPYEATTSAGVYTADNKLVKTLWRKRLLSAGTYHETWSGTDDYNVAVPAGTYTFKVIAHNLRYVWDGVIGNTSTLGSSLQGPKHHAGQGFIQSLVVDGTNAFYAMGEQEGFPPVRRFNTTQPQEATTVMAPNFRVGFSYVATDGVRLYVGNKVVPGLPTLTHPAFVTVTNVSDNSFANFTYGSTVCTPDATTGQCFGGEPIYQSCIDVGRPAESNDDPTGLAVQRNGNILAVSHGAQNLIRLFDKIQGNQIGTISVSNPGELAMTPAGDLWVISGTPNTSGATIRRYSNLGANSNLVATIGGLSGPVAIAVMPARSQVSTSPPDSWVPPHLGDDDFGPAPTPATGDVCNAAELLIVADGGAAQCLKAFRYDTTDSSTPQCWSTTPGGYATRGPDVASDKFQFQVGNRGVPTFRTALAATMDSIWVGDGATERLLRLNGSDRSYVDQIMFLTQNNGAVADPKTPTRLIGDGWLEFQIDYTARNLTFQNGGWSLRKNWAAGIPSNFLGGVQEGIQEVTTLSNGRVYGTITDFSTDPMRKTVVELPATGNLRICKDAFGNNLVLANELTAAAYGYNNVSQAPSFESDGSERFVRIANGRVTWYQRDLTSFDGAGNPQWGTERVLASAPYVNEDPIVLQELPIRQTRYPITSSGVLLTLDPTFSVSPPLKKIAFPDNNATIDWTHWKHLGGIALNRSDWSWKGSSSVLSAQFGAVGGNDLGDFDIGDGVTYAASLVMAQGRNVVYGYFGEFWKQTEASQWMHFYDNGLFIGQFGTPGTFRNRSGEALPGFTGNSFFPSLVGVNGNTASTTGETYLYADDKSVHAGVARWHLLGANNVREFSGSGGPNVALNGSIVLTAPPASFPTGLSAVPGDGQVSLSWQPVSNASSYDVKYSIVDGGPYTTVASPSGTSYTVSGLNDWTKYHFVVSVAGSSNNSDQATATPFDRVGVVGIFKGGPGRDVADEPFFVSSGVPSGGVNSGTGMSNLPSVTNWGDLPLARTRVGTLGYVLYNFSDNGAGSIGSSPVPFSTETNLASGITVSLPAGSPWINDPQYVPSRFQMLKPSGLTLGRDAALTLPNNATGRVNINVDPSDTAVHYLTVMSPSHSANHRDVNIWLGPQANPNVTAGLTIRDADGEGENRIIQFIFTGSVTLTLENHADYGACLQGLFID